MINVQTSRPTNNAVRLVVGSCILATLVLLTAAAAPMDEGVELRISIQPEAEVEFYDAAGEKLSHKIHGPHVTVRLEPGASVRVNDLDDVDLSVMYDDELGWTTFTGSYEVEVVRDGDVTSRFVVREARMVLGRFDNEAAGFVEPFK